jgi:mannonate dehydratase
MGTDHTIILNLPGRDEKVEAHKNFLRNAGKAGYHTVWNHYSGSSIWSTGREVIRSASGRAFDMEKARKDGYKSRSGETWYPDRSTHGRLYTEQEIWDNWTYFIKAIVPVAEEAGIRIALHPDDPPLPALGGIPRIFSSFEAFKRAFEIADSPNVGIYLCVGCWLEGGKLMGKNVLETIRYFGERNRIFKVDFRNVSAPLPHFVETYPDNGYMDMYKVMRALVEVNNHCVVCDDHVPETIGGRRVADAFATGYMRALLERANEEVKESDRLRFKGPYSS